MYLIGQTTVLGGGAVPAVVIMSTGKYHGKVFYIRGGNRCPCIGEFVVVFIEPGDNFCEVIDLNRLGVVNGTVSRDVQ